MAVLITDEMTWMTREMYEGMAAQLLGPLAEAPGFLAHAAGPLQAGGWQVTELWESQESHDAWFTANVAPNLPAGAAAPVTSLRDIVNVLVP